MIYPKKTLKQKKSKLTVRTAVIKDIKIATKDIPIYISQLASECDKSDSDSAYIPQITLNSGIYNNQYWPTERSCNNEQIEFLSNDGDGDDI